jgi:hypothetical protein
MIDKKSRDYDVILTCKIFSKKYYCGSYSCAIRWRALHDVIFDDVMLRLNSGAFVDLADPTWPV